MKNKVDKDAPQFIVSNGRPTAVILDIREYKQLLEKAEDIEDLRLLKEMRQKKLAFKKLDDFLKEYQPDV
jgi:prevent-host-death family protein